MLVWKVAPSPSRYGKCGNGYVWSRRSRCFLSRKVAPSLPRSGKSRVSALVWKVAPSPPRSRKTWKCTFWSSWPGRSRRCFLSRAVSWVAQYPPWSRKSRHLLIGGENPEKLFFKSHCLHVGLKSRAVSISVWKVWKVWKSSRIRQGRESRAWVFRSRKSGNGYSWSRESGHNKNKSRCFGRATCASVAKVAADYYGRESLEMPGFGRQSPDMFSFGLEFLDMPNFCRKSLDMSLGPRPGKFFSFNLARKNLTNLKDNHRVFQSCSQRHVGIIINLTLNIVYLACYVVYFRLSILSAMCSIILMVLAVVMFWETSPALKFCSSIAEGNMDFIDHPFVVDNSSERYFAHEILSNESIPLTFSSILE